LVPESDYFIFLAVEQNGQYSSNVTFVKGTTHAMYKVWGWLLPVGLAMWFIT